MSKEKGVCFFAYNNEQIDYINLAVLAAKFAKKHLGLPVCVITDEGTYSWFEQSNTDDDIENLSRQKPHSLEAPLKTIL